MPVAPPRHTTPEQIAARKRRDAERWSTDAVNYDWQWQKLRKRHMQDFPLCEMCKDEGYIRAGEQVDHIVPVKSDPTKRLDPANLRTLCASHHSQRTAKDRWKKK
jgi:5-methylcytosine-specific restriction protein A